MSTQEVQTYLRQTKTGCNLLVVSGRGSPELSVLNSLPPSVNVLGIGRSAEDFEGLTEDQWKSVDVLLNCGVGANAGKKDDIMALWPRLSGLVWLHSSSAGLEHLLFPELVNSVVVLTNAKGVYSNSLAEFVLTACNWFAKDLPRMRRAQQQGRWDPYDVEELRGKTLGVVGYGDIGQACARLARAFQMKVIALRRRAELSQEEKAEGLVVYTPDQLPALMAASDYVVAAMPHTPSTHELINAAAIAAMKPTGVFINVGRGKCVEEPALIQALESGTIRGAALDVFYEEPLPPSSPLWSLDNVLLSPHCADRTKEFQYESLELFVENLERYMKGKELLNICNKAGGY